MADRYGFFNRGNDGSSVGNEDFDEEDVWAVVKERKDISPKVRKSSRDSASAPKRVPTTARMVPRFNTPTTEGRLQQSAPVNIPDWSKIYGNKSSESYGHRDGSWAGYGVFDGEGVSGHCDDDDGNDDDDDDDDDDDNDKIPPHEWLARKLARSQISSFSVCEGAGRTLKGRDLSKVRNAILTKTGFLE